MTNFSFKPSSLNLKKIFRQIGYTLSHWQAFKKLLFRLSDLRLTVVMLIFLFVLVGIGTLYQVEYGLYAAQKKFFYSWFFLFSGLIPFPGAKLVLFILTINLVSASLVRYKISFEKIGILMIHYGIILLMVSSFITHYFAKESFVLLGEGETTTVSEDYRFSELAVWTEEDLGDGKLNRHVLAYDTEAIEDGQPIRFAEYGITLTPVYYYQHAKPAFIEGVSVQSASGLLALAYQNPPKEREKVRPGGLFEVRFDRGQRNPNNLNNLVLLWEAEAKPFRLSDAAGRDVFLKIQRRRYALPFAVKLQDFRRELYYASNLPKEYESKIQIIREGESAETIQNARVYMNHPFRKNSLTFFQASFSVDEQGQEYSVLAVVENLAYLLPYVVSILICLGVFVHFLIMFFKRVLLRRKVSAEPSP